MYNKNVWLFIYKAPSFWAPKLFQGPPFFAGQCSFADPTYRPSGLYYLGFVRQQRHFSGEALRPSVSQSTEGLFLQSWLGSGSGMSGLGGQLQISLRRLEPQRCSFRLVNFLPCFAWWFLFSSLLWGYLMVLRPKTSSRGKRERKRFKI